MKLVNVGIMAHDGNKLRTLRGKGIQVNLDPRAFPNQWEGREMIREKS